LAVRASPLDPFALDPVAGAAVVVGPLVVTAILGVSPLGAGIGVVIAADAKISRVFTATFSDGALIVTCWTFFFPKNPSVIWLFLSPKSVLNRPS